MRRYNEEMDRRGQPILDASGSQRFDVIFAGEPRWSTPSPSRRSRAPAAGAGLLDVARMLARAGLRAGLAAVIDDDRLGRSLRGEVAALGVDVGGVKLAAPVAELVVVDAGGVQSRVLGERGAAPELEVPRHWSAQVLLLAGLSAVTARLAALCKAARRARREGAIVVIDVAGGLRDWVDRDPRLISMVLREADVVRGSLVDLAAMGTSAAAVRNAMRSSATLVLHDPDHDDTTTTAIGPFGEVRVPSPSPPITPERLAAACTTAVCVELSRPRRLAETPSGRWHRLLGHEAPRLAASWGP
jgi:2-dehydro-3-deoxygluconokinase